MKFVIHFEDKGDYSADKLEAIDEDDALRLFREYYPVYVNIIKIKPLNVKPQPTKKMIEVKIFHNGG